MIGQILIHDALAGDAAQHSAEPAAVIVLPLVEPESLFDHIGIQMERLNGNIGSLDCPFEQRPEIFVWTMPFTYSIA